MFQNWKKSLRWRNKPQREQQPHDAWLGQPLGLPAPAILRPQGTFVGLPWQQGGRQGGWPAEGRSGDKEDRSRELHLKQAVAW